MRRLNTWGILICLILLMIGGIYGGYYWVNLHLNSVLDAMNQTDSLAIEALNISESMMTKESETQLVNVALFGLDSQEGMKSRSDAMKIVSLNLSDRKLKVTALQRDLLVHIPGEVNDFSKLNHAYQYGGAVLALKTLNDNFDLDITRYITFNFEAIEQIVEALGGVEVEIKQFEVDYSRVLHESGRQLLSGKQAMAYARMRQPDNDYERMDRQMTVMKGIFEKLKTLSLSQLYELLVECLPYVETNLSKEEMINWGLSALQFDLNEIEQYQIPENRYRDINQQVSYQNMNGLNILNSYEVMVRQLHHFIYQEDDYQPSNRVLEIETSIYKQFGYFEK